MQLQLWVSVLEVGCFFGLIALSFLLVLEGASVFNFAIGPYAMVAGLSTSYLATELGLHVLLAGLAGVVLAVTLSVLTETVVVRPITAKLGGNELPALVAVAATLFLIEQLAGTVFGRQSRPGQAVIDFEPIRAGAVTVQASQLVLVCATVVVFGLVSWWFKATRSGRVLRAIGDNSHAAGLLGLPVRKARLVSFALAGAVAGLAGLLFAPKAGVVFTSGLEWTLWGFVALVVGGTGSVWGPVLGGMLLAAVQIFAPYYLGSSATDYAVLAVAVLFFALRPQGVLVRRVRT